MKTSQHFFSSFGSWIHRTCRAILFGLAPATLLLAGSGAHGAPTLYMSSNSDDVNKFTLPGPVSNVAHLPFGTNPEGLAFDTAGNLFVAGGGDVSKITPGGAVSLFATLPSGAGGYGMVIDSANNLYVADVSLGQISKVDPFGNVSLYANVSSPRGLLFDGVGNLFVVTGGTVDVVAAGGGAVSTYATLTGHPNIYGLAFDPSGFLYVSDLTSTALLKIAPGGGSFTNFGAFSSGPKGLIFDGSNTIYAALPNEDKISAMTLAGAVSTFGTGLNGPRYLAIQPAPEPSGAVLLAAGVAVLLFRRPRSNAKAILLTPSVRILL